MAPTLGTWFGCIDPVSILVVQGWYQNLALKLGLADLANNLGAVHSNVAEIGEQLLSTVLAAGELEKLRGVLNC